MVIEARIREKLEQAFAPSHLSVENESGQHRVPQGSETHFRVVIVSPQFEGMSRVARQRRVFEVLAAEIQEGVHALSQYTFTPAEWEARQQVPSSPACSHARKE